MGVPTSAPILPFLLWLFVLAMILYLLPSACDIWRTRAVG